MAVFVASFLLVAFVAGATNKLLRVQQIDVAEAIEIPNLGRG
jgi:hypothetical protein